jgi:hypothetical protein
MKRAYIEQIQSRILPLKLSIEQHPCYNEINDLDEIRKFMQQHVFAVWDFMSLLKALQIKLTCTEIPWLPIGDPKTRFLINEIVCGEESDIAFQTEGNISHFELYLQAMHQAGASTGAIDVFLDALRSGKPVKEALTLLDIPQSTKEFVLFTFEVIETNKPHIMAAVFTFGREDLIPGMFISIVSKLNDSTKGKLEIFKYYLERHIEVDGDHHSHLALDMVSLLCGDDLKKWEEAEAFVLRALEHRKHLWDGVLAQEFVK